MRVFHRTYAAEAILAEGFRDAEGCYGTAYVYRGVWVSDVPLDENEGAGGDTYLLIEIPEDLFAQYEWVNEIGFGYREALIPAAQLNAYPVRQWSEAEEEACKEHGLRRQHEENLKRLGPYGPPKEGLSYKIMD